MSSDTDLRMGVYIVDISLDFPRRWLRVKAIPVLVSSRLNTVEHRTSLLFNGAS